MTGMATSLRGIVLIATATLFGATVSAETFPSFPLVLHGAVGVQGPGALEPQLRYGTFVLVGGSVKTIETLHEVDSEALAAVTALADDASYDSTTGTAPIEATASTVTLVGTYLATTSKGSSWGEGAFEFTTKTAGLGSGLLPVKYALIELTPALDAKKSAVRSQISSSAASASDVIEGAAAAPMLLWLPASGPFTIAPEFEASGDFDRPSVLGSASKFESGDYVVGFAIPALRAGYTYGNTFLYTAMGTNPIYGGNPFGMVNPIFQDAATSAASANLVYPVQPPSADSVASFASRGPCSESGPRPDVVAPGVSILSPWKDCGTAFESTPTTTPSATPAPTPTPSPDSVD